MNRISFNISLLILLWFYLLILHKIMRVFFQKPRKAFIRYILWIIYYIIQSSFIFGVVIKPQIILILNFLFIFSISLFSYYDSIKKCCIYSLVICALWMLVEIITNIGLGSFEVKSWEVEIAGSAISKMCMFFFAIIMNQCIKQKEYHDIPMQYAIVVLLIPVGSIYIMHHVFMIMTEHKEYAYFVVKASILLLLVNYMIFEVYDRMARGAVAQRKNLLYEQQIDLLNYRAEEWETYDREMRRFQHDMQNHMTSILGMIHGGKSEQAEIYIQEMLSGREKEEEKNISCSGNIVVDTIVNYKFIQARKKNITFDVNVCLPARLPFEGGHLTIVFGNLLDNALEACQEIEVGERYMGLEAVYKKDVLMVTVWNTYTGERKRDWSGKFLTTKRERKNHGLGLSSVEQAVRPYCGQLVTECGDCMFKAVVVMYGNNMEKRHRESYFLQEK